MKVWNKTSATDLVIATGSASIDRVTAQFYNASASDVEVTIKVQDSSVDGGSALEKIIKKFTLAAGETGHYHVNQLDTSDTVTVTTGATDLNIVTWN